MRAGLANPTLKALAFFGGRVAVASLDPVGFTVFRTGKNVARVPFEVFVALTPAAFLARSVARAGQLVPLARTRVNATKEPIAQIACLSIK